MESPEQKGVCKERKGVALEGVLKKRVSWPQKHSTKQDKMKTMQCLRRRLAQVNSAASEEDEYKAKHKSSDWEGLLLNFNRIILIGFSGGSWLLSCEKMSEGLCGDDTVVAAHTIWTVLSFQWLTFPLLLAVPLALFANTSSNLCDIWFF